MSSTKPKLQPIRILEYMNSTPHLSRKMSIQSTNRPSIMPERIRFCLSENSSKASSSNFANSVEVSSRKSTFAIPKKPVRRALYAKPSPSRSISSSSQSSIEVLPASQPKSAQKSCKARKSLLPRPKSIAQKYHTPQVVEENSQNVEKRLIETGKRLSVVKEDEHQKNSNVNTLEEPQVACQQRPTVIKSAINKRITFRSSVASSLDDLENKADDDLEKSIADKENIPPAIKVLEEKNCQFAFDPAQLDILPKLIEKLDKIELNQSQLITELDKIKENQTQIFQQMENLTSMLTVFNEKFNPISVPIVSSSPKPNINLNPQNDKENLTSGKKTRRSKSQNDSTERRRSLRIAAKSADRSNDSFVALENQVNVDDKQQSPASMTPKNQVRNSVIHSKSANSKGLREYLALKATMKNYLETPDHNGLIPRINIVNDTPSMTRSNRRTISHEVFESCHALFDDSE